MEVARAVSSVTQALELGTEDEHASVEDYEGSFEAVLRHKWSRQSLHVQCAVRLAGTETTPVVVVTVEIDDVDCSACLASNLDGQLKYASAGAEKLLGYVPGTMLSKSMTVEQIIPGPGGHLHAALVRGFFLKGESVPPDVPCAHGHIVSLRSKKGSLVPVRMRWKAHRAGSEVRGGGGGRRVLLLGCRGVCIRTIGIAAICLVRGTLAASPAASSNS